MRARDRNHDMKKKRKSRPENVITLSLTEDKIMAEIMPPTIEARDKLDHVARLCGWEMLYCQEEYKLPLMMLDSELIDDIYQAFAKLETENKKLRRKLKRKIK